MTGRRPYQEYKAASIPWLATIPKNWEVQPLFSAASERKVKNLGMRERNLLSLSYGQIVRRDINSNEGLLPESFETYQIVDRGDIVLRMTDLQNDQRSLRSALVRERGIITSAYIAVRPQSINPCFLDYLMRAYDVQKVFYAMGGGLRQSLKFEELRRLRLVIPSQPEQIGIVRFLDRETTRIDTLIAKKTRFIELLKEKRQAVITKAVTKGLDDSVEMKDSGVVWIGSLPIHWQMKRLKHIAKVQTGIAKGKDNAGKKTISVPYLRVANVQDGHLLLEDVATMEIPQEDLARYSLQCGDVLMNEGGDFDKLGRGHVWNDEITPCVHQNHVFAVRPYGVSSEWLNAFTSSRVAQFYFMGRSKQSTNLASISSTNLMELPVPVPPQREQVLIVESLKRSTDKLAALTARTERSIELLKEHRAALITAAVTGKIDVREAA
ncbi:restriction endonuclease subunit S [Thauera aminoaromatica]|jgi:type I restriction enzyme S subunit|uniref:Type I restriction modification DNA specificity domain-containing protein n=1 Tax=Thauera aminoaromatica TaxID=164330 RepID=A0A5C7T2U8_THASP|nr:restriction endonuclease subunit S [Thauera aminoaromatica]TXH90020.1 MAG: hypothetical protein E6Q80_03780 [Thauera aminoaromatica]